MSPTQVLRGIDHCLIFKKLAAAHAVLDSTDRDGAKNLRGLLTIKFLFLPGTASLSYKLEG